MKECIQTTFETTFRQSVSQQPKVWRRMNGKTILAVFVIFLLLAAGLSTSTRYITETSDSALFSGKWNLTTTIANRTEDFAHNWNQTTTSLNNSKSYWTLWNLTKTRLETYGLTWNSTRTFSDKWNDTSDKANNTEDFAHNWNNTVQKVNNSQTFWAIWNKTNSSVWRFQAQWNTSTSSRVFEGKWNATTNHLNDSATAWNQTKNSVTNWQATWNTSGSGGSGYNGSRPIYVSPSGSDSSGNGSIQNPYKSLQKAINVTKNYRGDTILLRGGVYNGKTLIHHVNGTAESYLTIKSYPGEQAILQCNNIYMGNDNGTIFIRNSSYIHIDNVIIRNSRCYGVTVRFGASTGRSGSHDIWISNCTIYNCSASAIYVYKNGISWVYNITIENNTCYDINNNIAGYNAQEGISLSGVRNFIVRYNHVSECGKECMDLKSGTMNGSCYGNRVNTTPKVHNDTWYECIGIYLSGSGTTTSGYVRNISVYNNNLYGNMSGIVISGESGATSDNISVFNNIVNITNAGEGPASYGIEIAMNAGNSPTRNVNIYSNTIYNSHYHSAGIASTETDETLFHNVHIYNNIISGNFYYSVYFATDFGTFDLSRNLHYRFNSTTRTHYGDGDNQWESVYLNVNPQFYNRSTFDLRLNYSSPCIDNATYNYVPDFDYLGESRYQGRRYDIGAYEMPVGLAISGMPTKRPLFPSAGDSWFNTTTGKIAIYSGTAWIWNISSGRGATGTSDGAGSITAADRAKWNATNGTVQRYQPTWNQTKSFLASFGALWNATRSFLTGFGHNWNLTTYKMNNSQGFWHNWNNTMQKLNNSQSFWTKWNVTNSSVQRFQSQWNASSAGGGNPFNQDLNTTDGPTFDTVSTTTYYSGNVTYADYVAGDVGKDFDVYSYENLTLNKASEGDVRLFEDTTYMEETNKNLSVYGGDNAEVRSINISYGGAGGHISTWVNDIVVVPGSGLFRIRDLLQLNPANFPAGLSATKGFLWACLGNTSLLYHNGNQWVDLTDDGSSWDGTKMINGDTDFVSESYYNLSRKIYTSTGRVYNATGANLQDALDDLNNISGTVWLPKGIINCSSKITLWQGSNLKGAGINVTILRNADGSSMTSGLVYASEKSNISISDLTINGNSAGATGQNAIDWRGVVDFNIHNLYIYDTDANGVRISSELGERWNNRGSISNVFVTRCGGSHQAFAFNNVSNFTISDLRAKNVHNFLDLHACRNVTGANFLSDDTDYGVKLFTESTYYCADITLSNFVLNDVDAGGYGFEIISGKRINVNNIRVDGSLHSLLIYNSDYVNVNNVYGNNAADIGLQFIDNSYLNANSLFGIDCTSGGLNVDNCDHSSFTQMHIKNGGNYNKVWDSDSLMFSDCSFVDCNTYNFDLATSSNIMITNCYFEGTAFYSDTNNNFTVDGCTFYDIANYGMRLKASKDFVISNCLFTKGSALGIAVVTGANSGFTITGCRFISNGGDGFDDVTVPSNNFTITNCYFKGNAKALDIAAADNYFIISNCIAESGDIIDLNGAVDNVTAYCNKFDNVASITWA